MTIMQDAKTPLAELARALAAFIAEREWGKFHTPRDLAMALSVEAAELLELFLWKVGEDDLPPRERLREELGDVLICLVNLATRLDVDLMSAAADKLEWNARKYPLERARGSARKWTDLELANGKEGGQEGGEDDRQDAAERR